MTPEQLEMIEKVRKIMRVASSTQNEGLREACEQMANRICNRYKFTVEMVKDEEPENWKIQTGTRLFKKMGLYVALHLFDKKVYNIPCWRFNRYGQRVPSYEVNAFQFMATRSEYEMWQSVTRFHEAVINHEEEMMKKFDGREERQYEPFTIWDWKNKRICARKLFCKIRLAVSNKSGFF